MDHRDRSRSPSVLARSVHSSDPSPANSVPLDEATRVHRFLLEECHRDTALDELRDWFELGWKSTWGNRATPENFHAWIIAALRSEYAAWPPLPGGLARGLRAANFLQPTLLKAVRVRAEEQFPSNWPFPPEIVDKAGLECYLETLRKPPGSLVIAEALVSPQALDTAEESLKQLDISDLTPQQIQEEVQKKLWWFAAESIKVWAKTFCHEAMSMADEIRTRWQQLHRENMEQHHRDLLRVGVSCTEASLSLSLEGTLPACLEGKVKRTYQINTGHADKLRLLFKLYGARFQETLIFEVHCWQLLARYHCLFGPDDEGSGMHMALLPSAFSTLAKELDVSHELFASPLNCSLLKYCSLFEDVDRFFGSCGSFFDFCRPGGPLVSYGGSYSCNPPFDEALIQEVVIVIENALAFCPLPLSISMVLPGWTGSGWTGDRSEGVLRARNSPFCRAFLRFRGEHHVYLNGLQHCCSPAELLVLSRKGRGSIMFMLQNDAGATRWPVSQEVLEKHRDSWLRKELLES